MNAIAQELNTVIQDSNPHVYEMLSDMGKALFFPKGILSQSAEAKEKAGRINATIGIAKEGNSVLSLSSVTQYIQGITPDEYLPYAPSFGIPALREKWKQDLYKKNPSLEGRSITLPVVTSGITHGVSILSDMWVNKGDVIVLPDMMWGNYNMTFCVRNGARIVHFKAYDEGLTRFNLDSFESVMREQAEKNDKIITILNFPHNPSGYTLSREEADRVAAILMDIAKGGTNVVAACDDAYFGLFFEEETSKESLFAKIAGREKRLLAVKLDGATKEDYVWGFRTGFVTYGICAEKNVEEAGLALEKKTAGCIRGNISNCSHLSQSILLKSMADPRYDSLKAEKFELLKARAMKMKEVLKDPKYREGFEVYPFNSGYFMCIRIKGVDAEKLRIHLLDQYGVGLISMGDENIRVAFSCLEEKDVSTLFDTILTGIKDLRS
ncbi:aminotransferase class I/II-fold pyridoxal phosphate-dependent enzyme [Desulfospira joergensenii]|uniref:aminotransferase class I/II-fold pyridoxal phosphate-dependent enzyme n=1 Tax=Desulfospira joergensenii TaxID=53329 RepID=UPI0003B6B26F|nr:aminotransferase class I/II-fold pyridoxal phosphate-dependent enzyme [Desulfospira joergensenii]